MHAHAVHINRMRPEVYTLDQKQERHASVYVHMYMYVHVHMHAHPYVASADVDGFQLCWFVIQFSPSVTR